MKYLIDITPKQAEGIQKYLDNGTYGSLSQFISAAIENQLSLERNEISGLVPFMPEEKNQKVSNVIAPKEQVGFEKYTLKNIPAYSSFVEAPGFDKLVYASQNIPEKQAWIWGQVNKIFPVKIGLRVLHQMLATKETVELNEFLDIAARVAVSFGDKIREYERQTGKMRDEKISAALPYEDEKSQTRFKFQFMVYPRKDNLLDGAMALMRFCNLTTDKKKNSINIAEDGLKFSCISNPVLDNDDFSQSLNKEECKFYIEHAKQNVKGEYNAIKWLLQQINKGTNERELLNKEIEKAFGKTWNATAAVINTQRAGLTARMYELGLIEKEKDGIHVKYTLSDFAKQTFEF